MRHPGKNGARRRARDSVDVSVRGRPSRISPHNNSVSHANWRDLRGSHVIGGERVHGQTDVVRTDGRRGIRLLAGIRTVIAIVDGLLLLLMMLELCRRKRRRRQGASIVLLALGDAIRLAAVLMRTVRCAVTRRRVRTEMTSRKGAVGRRRRLRRLWRRRRRRVRRRLTRRVIGLHWQRFIRLRARYWHRRWSAKARINRDKEKPHVRISK